VIQPGYHRWITGLRSCNIFLNWLLWLKYDFSYVIVAHTIFLLILIRKVDLIVVHPYRSELTFQQNKGNSYVRCTPQNVAVYLQKVELQISTSCIYHKIPIIFVKTIISVQFQGQIDTSAVQNVTNSKACAQQVKSWVVAHQADHANGPFGHTQQPTTNMLT
jgi:hypothetical protein